MLYQSGDIDGAIDTYQQALSRAPDHPRLAKQLEAWRKEAALHSGFGRRLADHFTVLFEGPAEAALAERAVEILERAYWRIGTALYTYPADVITVVLYTREQFRDVTQYKDVDCTKYVKHINRLVTVTNVQPVMRVNTITRVHNRTVVNHKTINVAQTRTLPTQTITAGKTIHVSHKPVYASCGC